jgi:hypothetical protein
VTVLEHVHPYVGNAGSGLTARTHTGTITWTRDDATQVVTMRIVGARTAGTVTSGMYVTFPAGTVPVEMRPERDTAAVDDPISLEELRTDGGGYIYVSGAVPYDWAVRYVTGSPVVVPEPEPEPEPGPTEFEAEFADWLVVTLDVETYLGAGPKGPVTSTPTPVEKCMVKTGNRLVRGSNGEERVTDTTIVTVLENAAHFTVESTVTLPDGTKRRVFQRAVDEPSLPLAHVRVALL